MRWITCSIIGIVAVALVAGIALRHDRGAMGADPSPPTKTTPEVTLRQVHLIETREGARLWELWADRAEMHEREGYSNLFRERHPVKVLLYSNQGQVTCPADRGWVDLKRKDVRRDGGVIARSDQGT